MIISTKSILPFDNEKLEIQCSYDEKGNFSGPGKVFGIDGALLCEGTFKSEPSQDHKSISYLKSGSIFIDDQEFKVSNFDGHNGYGVIITAFSALGLNQMDIKSGNFADGELDGPGIYVDNVATLTKGEFKGGLLVKGIRSMKSEVFEEYEYFDHTTKTARGKIVYPGEGVVLEGDFKFNGPLTKVTAGTLTSTANPGDFWEGEFYYGNHGWVFVNGKGKWDEFEGEVVNGKPINAQGKFDDNESVREDAYFDGRWESGLFDGEWIGCFEYPEACPECGEELGVFAEGKCKKCGHQSPRMSYRKEFKNGVLVRDWYQAEK